MTGLKKLPIESLVLERGLQAMQIGDKVIIKECHKISQIVGEQAEVVALAVQELSQYLITVRLTSSEDKGKFYGFREDELEPLSPDYGIPDIFKQ
jgi:hypothetical protein